MVALSQNTIGPELPSVLFIPGSIFPAADCYGKLLSILKDDINFIMKDHEIYADMPLETWRLNIEVEALRRFADSMGFDSFHVVGYSFGASLALAYASKYLERLRSIALVEPDWIGNIGMSSEELQQREELKKLQHVPPEKFLQEFMRLKVRSEVNVTQLDVTPVLEKRTVGVRAFLRSFQTAELLYGKLRKFNGPLYIAIGDLSSPVEEAKAKRLATHFLDCNIEVYNNCHHWTPPQISQPERFADALRRLWS